MQAVFDAITDSQWQVIAEEVLAGRRDAAQKLCAAAAHCQVEHAAATVDAVHRLLLDDDQRREAVLRRVGPRLAAVVMTSRQSTDLNQRVGGLIVLRSFGRAETYMLAAHCGVDRLLSWQDSNDDGSPLLEARCGIDPSEGVESAFDPSHIDLVGIAREHGQHHADRFTAFRTAGWRFFFVPTATPGHHQLPLTECFKRLTLSADHTK